jgi:hypothetical protein
MTEDDEGVSPLGRITHLDHRADGRDVGIETVGVAEISPGRQSLRSALALSL